MTKNIKAQLTTKIYPDENISKTTQQSPASSVSNETLYQQLPDLHFFQNPEKSKIGFVFWFSRAKR